MDTNNTTPYTLRQLVLYFLGLGTWGFGGPVALAGYMHRDLVEQRKWISEEDYKEGLALAQLAPGPLAAQLGIYIGYIHYRILGATLAGLAFVLPSFIMVVILGFIYTQWQGIPWMQAVFYGVGAAVIGIIAMSAWKLTRKSIGTDKWLTGIYLITAAYTVWKENENIWLFLGAGLIYWWLKSPRKKISLPKKKPADLIKSLSFPLLFNTSLSTSGNTLWQLLLYFTKAGALVFGSGLAIVPFLYGGVVKEHAWLNEQQFMDAVAVAMITPGPVVITVAFIGFLVAGFAGACVAALGTFFPSYIFTVIPAPYFRKYGKHPGIKAFVDGVTAAAIGAISGAVVVLGKRSLTDAYTIAIAIITVVILWRFKKIPEPLIILAAAGTGLLLKNIQ
ncbi:chromate transporter [Chitinophaga ginsengisegetis]|uniref:chromate transporter n=1 Tax=Chitinophaga ginsengisegetis TaxID=393003 RepID=UPI000DB94700|nr:chromate transporter [Chitinophaga ginsengisegetis]MDR6571158.1 chromate transporter [Chitinophaga ginsengisegetis]MDR6650892.1 chromate transporter [Chitinophaga ginsengisegetis]MDR6657221.1 chromate transporter [Chitinophaga ginsengisegetis]